MKVNHVWHRTAICRWLAAAALCCLSLNVTAQTATSGLYFDSFKTSGGTTVATGPNRTVTAPGAKAANGQMIWDQAVKTDGGMPKVDGNARITNPSGRAVPVTGTARIPASQVAGAVGRAIGKNLIPGVGVAIAIKEVAEELGWGLEVNPDGSASVSKPSGYRCLDGGTACYEFYYTDNNGGSYGIGYPTYAQACAGFAVQVGYRKEGCNHVHNDSGWTLFITSRPKVGGGTAIPILTPAETQEFIDKIASRSGWPSSSSIKKVLDDDMKTGGVPQTTTITVSGPATSAGTTTTTNNTTNNTTTTNTTTHNHTYNQNVVNTTTTTTSITINNTTGAVTNSETTTDNADPVEEKEDCPTGSEKAACATLDTPEGEIPKVDKEVTFSAENLGLGSGVCPANIVKTINGQSVTVFSYTKPCEIISGYVAPLVVLLSTWIAFFIVMPGGKPE